MISLLTTIAQVFHRTQQFRKISNGFYYVRFIKKKISVEDGGSSVSGL